MFVEKLDSTVCRDEGHTFSVRTPTDRLDLLHTINGRANVLGILELHLKIYRFEFKTLSCYNKFKSDNYVLIKII